MKLLCLLRHNRDKGGQVLTQSSLLSKMLIKGNGYLCSPNMESFAKRMIALDEQREAERLARPSYDGWGVDHKCDLQRILNDEF